MLAKQLSGLRAGKLREISAENQITNQKKEAREKILSLCRII